MLEHPSNAGVRQSKPTVFYGGSRPPSPALVGLVSALLQEKNTLGREKSPRATSANSPNVTSGLGQGADPG